MTRHEYKGGAAQLTLSGNINASGVTTINTVGTVTGWPTGGTGKFLIVIDKGNAGEEKVYCSSRTGNALTVASDADRGADGTSPASHTSGVTINHCGGAVDLDEPNAHINLTANDDHTQYLNTARHDVTARHVFGSAYGTPGTPVDVDPAVSAAAGSAAGPPHSDHIHGLVTSAPRGSLGQATVTTNQTGISTGPFTDLAGLAVTVTVPTGRRVRITASFLAQNNSGPSYATAAIREGATTLKTSPHVIHNSNQDEGWYFAHELVPSAASHTYKLSFSAGSGTSQMSASATDPAWILVEDIGT